MSRSDQYRRHFETDLARLIGCPPDELPASTNLAIAAEFLGLTNPRTLLTWKAAGQHEIAVVKIGRVVEPTTQWLLEMKLRGLKIAQAAA